MRLGLPVLLLALLPGVVTSSAFAEVLPTTVTDIDSTLTSKQSELTAARKALDEQQAQVSAQQTLLRQLSQQAQSRDKALAKAKSNLERDYQRMIDDPNLDISATQQTYQQSWADVKQSQILRLEAQQKLAELKSDYDTKQATVDGLKQAMSELSIARLRARADRLKNELKPQSTLKVSFTNRCQATMTLAQCDQQTRDLSLQKAVKQFQAELLSNTSEAPIVRQHAANVSLNIHVLSHNVTESGFYDGSRYRAILDVTLEARAAERVACQLLGIETKYCFAPGVSDSELIAPQEVAWVSLNVRSNQYDDHVVIDGVSYGSTPVEVMLPTGKHQVTISKSGYRPFSQEITIHSDQSLRAVLHEYENRLKPGHQFADSVKGKLKAPDLVTITPGQYYIGESASHQVRLDHAFAIGVTPVTVRQFETFVDSTQYQSDAELKNICTTIKDSDITAISQSYWRNPGFKQTPDSPVVCVSRNDAEAYISWLSKFTGFHYRLPTEEEWEIAARAGKHTHYWWGDEFKAGQANTGWSGSPWSNVSTAPVKSFSPNPIGIYDTVGNVWQWTSDERGVAKGGAWNFSPEMSASHQQLFIDPSATANYVGFRVVRTLK
ncbi:Formylglycine-generating enzyme, required for sulfatase activity, contains SUMF1/FGE domain [Vibrio xiamenensis]|uniref:Formylglycine-generating enzyme, required for sulfatase activity, contains SUMF1/FGE domain n=1 Tax=Vibrio xiamenensis TaxID=861298 RepID=A0A1G7XKF2_9VIBR|nr:SUMF1/EgtB/PvdO family nonheme iron enzyme [Vibrio xiamenensis]SDG84536.1 Formylglycine-generating enzyme, required for sulfatase activity, contains SUMF1/FGE domain [Vibrio xiamenensis]